MSFHHSQAQPIAELRLSEVTLQAIQDYLQKERGDFTEDEFLVVVDENNTPFRPDTLHRIIKGWHSNPARDFHAPRSAGVPDQDHSTPHPLP